ncbi:Uncharacterised protein [Yersinia intermedia]|uniref:hypothetical protein n=1 Tax=Yersinia intermedia TaxID=631 RepID=UPI0005E43763|nr:hypothetical protein [Yersinia intermedia]CNH15598.1 Uncharacterised protein [Yersinia intermedia]CQD77875.1 Uncharacterised protein [Yersinia intermedia]
MFNAKNLSIEGELRHVETLLAATAELWILDSSDDELAFELLDKALVRVREIKAAYLRGDLSKVEGIS